MPAIHHQSLASFFFVCNNLFVYVSGPVLHVLVLSLKILIVVNWQPYTLYQSFLICSNP